VRHGDGSPLVNTRHALEENPGTPRKGVQYAVLHAIIDHVIDCYIDIAGGLDRSLQVENRSI
jgi:magnesium transporter